MLDFVAAVVAVAPAKEVACRRRVAVDVRCLVLMVVEASAFSHHAPGTVIKHGTRSAIVPVFLSHYVKGVINTMCLHVKE